MRPRQAINGTDGARSRASHHMNARRSITATSVIAESTTESSILSLHSRSGISLPCNMDFNLDQDDQARCGFRRCGGSRPALWNQPSFHPFPPARQPAVSTGRDRDGGHWDFSGFSQWPTKWQSSSPPVRPGARSFHAISVAGRSPVRSACHEAWLRRRVASCAAVRGWWPRRRCLSSRADPRAPRPSSRNSRGRYYRGAGA